MSTELTKIWDAPTTVIVPAAATTPQEIAACARQLSARDVQQIIIAFNSGSYEMVSTFVWTKSIAALKRQISSLGMEFVGEMLNRPDITEHSSIENSVTEYEAINLAQDLGMFSTTEAMRLKQSQHTIAHFASMESSEGDAAEMMPEEAIHCLRACVQSILGHPKIDFAVEFSQFRRKLEDRTFKSDDDEILTLQNSPYFAQRTTLSVLLAMLKTAEGAQLEHAIGNANAIVPLLWPLFRKPERWQTGKTYAEIVSAGRRTAAQGLFAVLRTVQGFDFVPENLRSNTFTKAAKNVLQAHEGMNNFYNEPRPMEVLSSLGTTIPLPAFPICMTATLAVHLGNGYGISFEAQPATIRLLDKMPKDRWEYYFNECMRGDRLILEKLAWYDKPGVNWINLVRRLDLNEIKCKYKPISNLLIKSADLRSSVVKRIATEILTTV